MSVNETKHPLPPGVFDAAMDVHRQITEARIWGLYARVRAVFVESIIAELVDGEMILNPNCAWDVNMPLPGWQRPVRIQIKCSGERLARWPDKIIPASWEVDGPKRGRDEKFEDLGRGYHCDVFVFARHEGKDIDSGWHFYVLSKESVEGAEPAIKTIKPLGLEGLGAKRCDPADLKACIIEVVSRDDGG